MFIAGHEVWIDRLDLLSHQAELRDTFGIKFFLVTEGDWFEREKRLARLIHRLNVVLKARRRGAGAQVPIAIDDHSNASRDRHSVDTGNVGVGVGSDCANPDRSRLTPDPDVAEVDVVAAGGQRKAGAGADRDIVRPGAIFI